MAVFPIHLLIAFCLCVISSPCSGQSCTEDSIMKLTVYARPKDNRIDCHRTFHGNNAVYSWEWYDESRRGHYPIPANHNITTDGSIITFDLLPTTKGFMCVIEKPDRTLTGPIVYDIIEAKIIQSNPNGSMIYYNVTEYSFLSVECSVQGIFIADDIYFIWYSIYDDFEQMINDTQRTYVDKRGNLNFSPVLSIDELYDESRMYYHCVVNSTKLGIRIVGPQVLIFVAEADPNVVRPSQPLLQYVTPDITARINDSIMLECIYSNDDPNSLLTYKWYDPHGVKVQWGTGYLFYNQDVYQRIFLDFVQPHYKGHWYCGADNKDFSSFRQGIYVDVTC